MQIKSLTALLAFVLGFCVISEADICDSIKVYPNPFQDSVNIMIEGLDVDTVNFNVFDINGKKIKTFCQDSILNGNVGFVFVNTTGKDGMFIFNIEINDSTCTKRVISAQSVSLNEVDERKSQEIRIYPNPTSSALRIKMNKEFEEIVVTGLSGKVHYRESIHSKNYQLDVSGFAAGVYLVRLRRGDAVVTEQFVVE